MTDDIPPSLVRFGEALDRAAHRELAGGTSSLRQRVTRPRVLAGGTLGVAGLAAAVTLAFSGGAAAPAFAVTTESDGGIQVTISEASGIVGANAQLRAMGLHEQIVVEIGDGPASTPGPVTCTPGAGVTGPRVDVLFGGGDGSEVIAAGRSAGNTAEGTFHVVSCSTLSATGETSPAAISPGAATPRVGSARGTQGRFPASPRPHPGGSKR